MNSTITTSLIALTWMALAWFIGDWLGLKSPQIWVLRITLALLGALAAAIYLWYRRKEQQRRMPQEQAPSASGDEFDNLFREAEKRLAAGHATRGARIANLPLVLVLGDGGSTKTTAIVQSGIEPELLAGQAHGDGAVVSTKVANIWYARGTIFLEPSESIQKDQDAWARLVRRVMPATLASVVGRRQVAPRTVVVCADAERFLQSGGAHATGQSVQNLWARLNTLARALGVRLPVYILFTRLDRIAFFREFCSTLTNEEAAQVYGVTLPLGAPSAGAYAEQETARLAASFEELFESAADRRPDFLARESDPARLGAIYEFPREFRKLRLALTQFMVDLCRPTQLGAGPYLRGYYFTGVRPIVVRQALATPARQQPQQAQQADLHASGVFRMTPGAPAQSPGAPVAESYETRKIPQWVFLSGFFHRVLLADTAALGAAGRSSRTPLLQRILLAGAVVTALLITLGFTISYFRNQALETSVADAARSLAGVGISDSASLRDLERLESLRQHVETLGKYRREGAPLSYRWGLYQGKKIEPSVRAIYFQRFHQLLFGATQQGMLASLRSLPESPGPNDRYDLNYDTLKAYLITTSNHDKSTVQFLAPFLTNRWVADRDIDPQKTRLARKQFEFYSAELKEANPFSSAFEDPTVGKARKFLEKFASDDRLYLNMLAEAEKAAKSENFNRRFPGSERVVVNGREVPAAFTKAGWTFMQDAFANPGRFLYGEAWVLGEQRGSGIDAAAAAGRLKVRYSKEYINHWREYLKTSVVQRYASASDAAAKLKILSGPQSPLLAMFWLAAQNTAVDAPDVQLAFKPLHVLIPPSNAEQYVVASNEQYVQGLVSLQIAVEEVAKQPGTPDDATVGNARSSATSAMLTTRQMAVKFGVDPEAKIEATIQKLLEDPIKNLEGLVKDPGPARVNAAGAVFCGQFRALFSKYPFNPNSKTMATLDEVNLLLKPQDGALWQFYEQTLKPLMVKTGNAYTANPASQIRVTPGFVSFFNNAANFSTALYPPAGGGPKFNYTVRAYPVTDVPGLRLQIDGQTLEFSGRGNAARQFSWPGTSNQMARLGGQMQIYSFDGLWAVFELFQQAEKFSDLPGGGSAFEWIVRVSNKPIATVRVDVEMNPPLFRRGFFSRLTCVSEVAR